jgi:hypothetical protein
MLAVEVQFGSGWVQYQYHLVRAGNKGVGAKATSACEKTKVTLTLLRTGLKLDSSIKLAIKLASSSQLLYRKAEIRVIKQANLLSIGKYIRPSSKSSEKQNLQMYVHGRL